MTVVHTFPRPVRVVEHLWIPLADGTRLAAKMWLPEDAEADPVPALLEYLPYRKRDGTRGRDHPMHAYLAGHGYASVRVDIRGSGDSEGVIRDEYAPQEQDDGVEVIAWLARQPWCTGAVGMFGLSWGGFNALQIAARHPPALKAIITLGSTDDRYATDVHYLGGCLVKDNIDWGGVIFSFISTPPDPAVVGERWREQWLQRLEALEPWVTGWLRHQRRDGYWRHGSVCEDFDAIRVPVYAVSGWADHYADAVPRLLAGLKGPRKGLIGPWGHAFPQRGSPGPPIGFLQEALRWWDHWLKGRPTGIMDEPMLRAWMQESVPPAPAYAVRPGRWVAETAWPSPRIEWRRLFLAGGRLAPRPGPQAPLLLRSPLTTGLAGRELVCFGGGAEQALDQREDDGGSLVFLSDPVEGRLEFLGAPTVELAVASDQPHALLAARLCDVSPDGASTLITWGALNLAHRGGHAEPRPLDPGVPVRVRVQLKDTAWAVPPGHRLALGLSSSYWPLLHPPPRLATLTVLTGPALLLLPVRPPHADDAALSGFPPPEEGPSLPATTLRQAPDGDRIVRRDVLGGRTTVTLPRDSGRERLDDIDLEVEERGETRFSIVEGDPGSAEAATRFVIQRRRGAWAVRTETRLRMTCTPEAFRIRARLIAHEDGTRVFLRRWDEEIPRDGL